MSWLSKILPSPVKNFFRAPDRIIHNVIKGDVKKAASVVVNPFAGKQTTRDRTLRRAGGAISGGIGGIWGGPVGIITGATIGGLKAGKGHGQLKDYATDALVGVAAGGAAGAAAGALGFGKYGGIAGRLGSGLSGKLTGGAPRIAKTLAGGASTAKAFTGGEGQPATGETPPLDYNLYRQGLNATDNGFTNLPFSPGQFNFPDGTVIKGYSVPEKKKISWTGPALLTVGAVILTR